MADEPKPAGAPNGAPKPTAPAPASSGGDPFVEMVSIVGGIFILLYILNALVVTVTSSALFSHGLQGLTPQGIILDHTRPIASLANPLGVSVVALHTLTVYNNPGETKVGTQALNARGKILQGPVEVGGVNYYYVDFVTGPDGWVAEGDIGFLMSEPTTLELIIMQFWALLSILKIISFIVSVCAVAYLVYVIRRLTALRANERKLLYPESATRTTVVNPKWERVLAHVESQNENDWRLAILEADIILADLLGMLSLPGDTIADKLKAIEQSDFTTIDKAWEAHKVRNQIAHEGADFQLSQREARRVVELYRVVFEEFKII